MSCNARLRSRAARLSASTITDVALGPSGEGGVGGRGGARVEGASLPLAGSSLCGPDVPGSEPAAAAADAAGGADAEGRRAEEGPGLARAAWAGALPGLRPPTLGWAEAGVALTGEAPHSASPSASGPPDSHEGLAGAGARVAGPALPVRLRCAAGALASGVEAALFEPDPAAPRPGAGSPALASG